MWSKLLSSLLVDSKLSNKDLALRLSMSEIQVDRWLSGQTIPPIGTMKNVLRILLDNVFEKALAYQNKTVEMLLARNEGDEAKEEAIMEELDNIWYNMSDKSIALLSPQISKEAKAVFSDMAEIARKSPTGQYSPLLDEEDNNDQ